MYDVIDLLNHVSQLGQYEQKMQLLKQELKKMQDINRASENEVRVQKHTKEMSLVMRKPVFGVCDQVRLKPACSATGTR